MKKTLSLMACMGLFAVCAELNRVPAMSSTEMQSIVGGAPCFIYKAHECVGVAGGCEMVECTPNSQGAWSCGISERLMKQPNYDNATLGAAGDEGMTLLTDADPLYYPCVKKEFCVEGVACVDGFVWRETTIEVLPGIWITISYITTGQVCSGQIPQVMADYKLLQDLDGEECTIPLPPL